jgi:hypothetical protein
MNKYGRNRIRMQTLKDLKFVWFQSKESFDCSISGQREIFFDGVDKYIKNPRNIRGFSFGGA